MENIPDKRTSLMAFLEYNAEHPKKPHLYQDFSLPFVNQLQIQL
jgi:hypothetical protein